MDGSENLEGAMSAKARTSGTWKRFLPIAVLTAGAVVIFAFDLQMYLSFEALSANREWLSGLVDRHWVWAAIAFAVIYALATALSVPGGAVLSVTGGFLFGGWQGGIIVVVGATIGATAVFLIARTALGDALRARAGPWLAKMESGFQENALSYLLTLRLIPIFPFFVVNLVPAFLGVPLATYVLGTAVGIVPGALVFTYAGAGLGAVFDTAGDFSINSILTPEILLALTGLGLLSLLPVVYSRFKRAA